ncbi:hypothetical protein F5887DRAFT_916194 [Amanita rubescens]|nr:hypothetical protein F5887DRAFT_916194 [Amanita rubescens]
MMTPRDKLAFLGERLLNFAIARHWYENLPQISSQDLQEKTEQTLSDDLLRACIDKYELQRNLRRASQSDIGPDDARDFLNVYIGLLYTQAGVPGVQRWVSALIDPNESTPPPPGTPTSINASSGLVTLARFNEHVTQRLGQTVTWKVSDSGEAHRVLWTMTVLSGFNEVAAKQHLQIAWDYARSGDPHMPTWRVTCLVNGNHMGTGVGRNKKESMLAAARDAWRNMGWP